MTPAEEYINSIKGKKVAFVGMGVANTPCAEFLAKNGIETYACDMRDKKYYIVLDDFERRVVVNCLNEMRNNLIANGKYTDAVD